MDEYRRPFLNPGDFSRTWPNQEEISVTGKHFIQEDSSDEIGQAVATFIRKITQ